MMIMASDAGINGFDALSWAVSPDIDLRDKLDYIDRKSHIYISRRREGSLGENVLYVNLTSRRFHSLYFTVPLATYISYMDWAAEATVSGVDHRSTS